MRPKICSKPTKRNHLIESIQQLLPTGDSVPVLWRGVVMVMVVFSNSSQVQVLLLQEKTKIEHNNRLKMILNIFPYLPYR